MGNKFKVKKVTPFNSLETGTIDEIPTSDLCLTSNDSIVQFEYIEDEEHGEKYMIKPGTYTVNRSSGGLRLDKTELREDHLLTTIVNTSTIKSQVDIFFKKLHVYDRLKLPKKRAILLYSDPGCHAKGQEILMYDGTIKLVEDIAVGDLLMGPDSKPREVLKLVRGKEEMVRINPVKGESFVVNKNHILSLRWSGQEKLQCPINISVKDYMANPHERLKLYKSSGVEFQNNKELPIDPYIFGMWLGDGHSGAPSLTTMDSELADVWTDYVTQRNLKTNVLTKSLNKASTYTASAGPTGPRTGKNSFLSDLQELEVINNKHIPQIYKTASRADRLHLLAGLIDTDGHYNNDGTFEITQKNMRLADDIVFLARSLGFAVYKKESHKGCQTGAVGVYQRMNILGDLDLIPTRLARKQAKPREQIKDCLRNGFTTEMLPVDDFYGFTVDGDHLYLMGDFTVTHNCGKSSTIRQTVRDLQTQDPGTVAIIWPTSDIRAEDFSRFLSFSVDYEKECTNLILIMEDIGGNEEEGGRVREVNSGLLNMLDGVNVVFKLPTFIIATTNYPSNLLGALSDRPGRFDEMIELAPPAYDEQLALMEFIAQRKLTTEEASAFKIKGAEKLSIAHLNEIVVRSELQDKSYEQVIKEMIAHTEKVKKDFSKSGSMGIRNSRWDD